MSPKRLTTPMVSTNVKAGDEPKDILDLAIAGMLACGRAPLSNAVFLSVRMTDQPPAALRSSERDTDFPYSAAAVTRMKRSAMREPLRRRPGFRFAHPGYGC